MDHSLRSRVLKTITVLGLVILSGQCVGAARRAPTTCGGWVNPPAGAAPWWNTPVKAGEVSDPFLMTGFDEKVVHLTHDAREPITFVLEVDFLGDGSWRPYKSFTVNPESNYAHHEFPDGFSAHWVRVKVDKDCNATVSFMYN